MTRYAAVRTDREIPDYLFSELEQGRLRQGWGYHASQDLRSIRAKLAAGSELTNDEKVAWRNRRMFVDARDGFKSGDILLLPNLPVAGRWVFARVVGGYRFEIDPERQDYGHLLEVEPIKTAHGDVGVVHPNNRFVAAPLRRSLRARCRIWSLDQHSELVEAIVEAIEKGHDTQSVMTADEKFDAFSDAAKKSAFELVTKSYGGAEFEDLVARVLESAYQQFLADVSIERRGGPAELGADLIVSGFDPVGLPYHVAVQVKLHDGTEADHHALEQVAKAHTELREDLQAGLVVTTAERVTPGFERRRAQIEAETNKPLKVLLREDFLNLLAVHLGAKPVGTSSDG